MPDLERRFKAQTRPIRKASSNRSALIGKSRSRPEDSTIFIAVGKCKPKCVFNRSRFNFRVVSKIFLYLGSSCVRCTPTTSRIWKQITHPPVLDRRLNVGALIRSVSARRVFVIHLIELAGVLIDSQLMSILSEIIVWRFRILDTLIRKRENRESDPI